jgi:hypothetical protein
MKYYIVKDGDQIVGFYTGTEKPVGKVVIELDRSIYLKTLLDYIKDKRRKNEGK